MAQFQNNFSLQLFWHVVMNCVSNMMAVFWQIRGFVKSSPPPLPEHLWLPRQVAESVPKIQPLPARHMRYALPNCLILIQNHQWWFWLLFPPGQILISAHPLSPT